MANYLLQPLSPIVPTAIGGAEVAARYNRPGRGAKRVAETLNNLYAKNGTPCVNDQFLASQGLLTSSDTQTHRYRFRTPFGTGQANVDSVRILVYGQRATARLGEPWSIKVTVNGVLKTVTLAAYDTYISGAFTRGVWSLGAYGLNGLVLQEVALSVGAYEAPLTPADDYCESVCIVPVRSLTSIPGLSYARDVYALPQDEVDAQRGTSTWQKQWMRRMEEAMYQDRVSNLFTSTQIVNQDLTADGVVRLAGLQSSVNMQTQVLSSWTPTILPGVSEIEAWVYTQGGGTLQLVTDRSDTVVNPAPGAGWTKLVGDVSSTVNPKIYFGALGVAIESVCVYEATASLP